MNIVKIECPACGQHIECGEAEARAGVKCPGCDVGFVSERFKAKAAVVRLPSATVSHRRRIYERAVAVELVSYILFGLVGLCLGLTLLAVVSGEESKSIAIWGGGFFGLACWTNLIAQLLHIRAALSQGQE